MGLWTYFNRLQQGLQPPVEGCRRNPQNSSLWMTMPRCLVLNGNGTCVKTGVISVAYVTKMSHCVQIARPSNHGLDVVSQCKSSHLDRSSAYCHHSLFISDIWLLKSHFFRLKTRPCQGVMQLPHVFLWSCNSARQGTRFGANLIEVLRYFWWLTDWPHLATLQGDVFGRNISPTLSPDLQMLQGVVPLIS